MSKIAKFFIFDRIFDKTKINGHVSRTIPIFGWVLLEKHHFAHMCSYCDRAREDNKTIIRMKPGIRSWNAWWVWGIKSGTYRYYFRYHSPFFDKKIQTPPKNKGAKHDKAK